MNNIILIFLSVTIMCLIVEFLVLKLNAQKRESSLKSDYESEKILRQQAEQQIQQLRIQHDQELKAQRETMEGQRERMLAEMKRSYDENLKFFKDSLRADTEQLLKERSESLQQSNTRQMENLVKPLRENIVAMEQSITQNREAQAKNTETLQQSIVQMMARTVEIGTQADRLSDALQHQNKTMGNWGEMVLTRLLESQGLREGIHYESQLTLRDKDGRVVLNNETHKRMVPDVILHLADNRDVIIDSKVSLTAFVEYQSAKDAEEQASAAQRHIDSLRSHVRELSEKNYSDYIAAPRISCDFVIMFLPHEGAMQLLMATEPALWDEAFNKYHVFIVGGQNLVAAMRIIDLTWRQVLQERNTQKVMEEAGRLVDRVRQFYEHFLNVEKGLTDVQKAFEEVKGKVSDGKQSILTSGRKLEELGVKGKKTLPAIEE